MGKIKHSDGAHKPLSRRKKVLFSFITLLLPILLLVFLEAALRAGNYGGDLDLFIFPERFDGKYGMLNHHYHEKFFPGPLHSRPEGETFF